MFESLKSNHLHSQKHFNWKYLGAPVSYIPPQPHISCGRKRAGPGLEIVRLLYDGVFTIRRFFPSCQSTRLGGFKRYTGRVFSSPLSEALGWTFLPRSLLQDWKKFVMGISLASHRKHQIHCLHSSSYTICSFWQMQKVHWKAQTSYDSDLKAEVLKQPTKAQGNSTVKSVHHFSHFSHFSICHHQTCSFQTGKTQILNCYTKHYGAPVQHDLAAFFSGVSIG